jgi:DNA-binding transcriptional MerR regulator
MNWLPIKEVAKRSGKAERTLRLYASQGRVKAKKDGREWLLEINSLKNVKIILAEPTAKVAAMPNVAAKITAKSAVTAKNSGNLAESSTRPAKTSGKIAVSLSENKPDRQTAKESSGNGKKYKMLNDLGVYKDLVDLWFEFSLKDNDNIALLLKHAIEQVAIGFYEFHAERKVLHFRNARECVVKAIAGITIHCDQTLSSLCRSLENEIVPGLIGLIKRYEKVKK